jgi:hypothetical protein
MCWWYFTLRINSEDRPPSQPPLLTPQQWTSLKAICDTKS